MKADVNRSHHALSVQEKSLEPMQFGGAATYGSYFTMAARGPYRIELEIRGERVAKPVKSTQMV